MITRIEIEQFKCFQLLKLPLGALTLLSGPNASGKTTVMQAMVLLHQTILEQEWATRLQLNGAELQLGCAKDVVDKVNGRYEFTIRLIDTECSVEWTFDCGEDRDSMSVAVGSVQVNGRVTRKPERLRFLLPESMRIAERLAKRLKNLTYVTAERVGPREFYELRDPVATQVVGRFGENAVGMLYQQRDNAVSSLIELATVPPSVLRQVEARMKMFFPGTSLIVNRVPQTNIVTLGLKTSDATDFHRPIHVGFGLTQVLPIVVAALASQEGDLLLIENPEVHLHPAGQALMGQFLTEVAAAGVQVLIESHSDHVLNGIRRAVKAKKLPADRVAIHFFQPRDEQGSQVASPILDSSGNIDHWPHGFFDQIDKDLNHFAGWGD